MDELTPTELARLANYFVRELDPAEAVLVERWIEECPERQRFVETLRRSRIDLSVNAAAHVVDLPAQVAMLSRSLAGIRVAERSRVPQSLISHSDRNATRHLSWFRRRSIRHTVGYTAGALFAGMLLVFAGWRLAEMRHGVLSATSVSTYATGNGERATVTLPDGSTVLLNVGSRLHVPSNYAEGNRTVHLAGQAFFTVASHSRAPFTVIAGPSVTRVLGTRFVVRHYESDTAATILVRDGKVAVGSSVLTAAQEVAVSAAGNSEVRRINMNTLSFTQGVLTLNKMPLVAAIPDLNRWYDVEIRLGDPILNDRQIDGGFKAGSLSDLVSILELMYDARVVREGRVLTLYPRG